MSEPRVIVVGETRSLGVAVAELLVSDGLEVVLVETLDEGESYAAANPSAAPFVLVAAASGRACATAVRWPESSLRDSELVVVGAREVDQRYRTHLHLVPLPLEPHRLLALVRLLLGLPLRERTGYSDPAGAVRFHARTFATHRTEPTPELVPRTPTPPRLAAHDFLLRPRASPSRA